ncbi:MULTISPECIES: hypothetical protein [Leifsonia]|uniref:Uncharacterized protein n=3 Tax=Leifsonia TaxID=110932 RepID=U2R1I8_LEIAQ|nr:hypothetical protein [Leifsonia aquatica]ERK69150.1 hypothetical protein N136_04531 [Leifsonia aquatica ATCC 14665]MBB2967127.1 hypothetical protein [Leifsonia aquatica]NYK11106.1 hypothetical protein [Leifsonia naganoensis]
MKLRITTATGKVAYIIGGYGLLLALNVFLFQQLVDATVDVLIVAVLNLLYVGIGVRIFRGAGENREDPRPWWRATARPAAGFWIGGGLAAAAFVSCVGALASRPENSFIPTVACVCYAVLAAFYLHSSVRLLTMDTAA